MQAATYQLPSLYGDSATTAQSWMHEFEKFMAPQAAGMTVTGEKKHKIRQFPKFLLGEAREWWDELTPQQQESWDQTVALFNVRWPKPKAAKPDHEERILRFRAKKLTRAELDQRVRIPNASPDDTRWRITEFAEELEVLGRKTASSTDDLILFTYEQVPPSVAKLMRDWRNKNKDADWADFCGHLAELDHADISAKQGEVDAQLSQKAAIDAQASMIAQQQRELEQLRATISRMGSPPARGRGAYARAQPLPPYASREASPLRNGQLDPHATPFIPRRQSTLPPPPTPASPDRTLTPSTPKSNARPPPTCMRCGEPLSETHRGALQCRNPPMPPEIQTQRIEEMKRARFTRSLTPVRMNQPYPPTPGTPSPDQRTRDVYSLNTEHDDEHQIFLGEQFLDGDETDDLALILAEELGPGNGLEAGN